MVLTDLKRLNQQFLYEFAEETNPNPEQKEENKTPPTDNPEPEKKEDNTDTTSEEKQEEKKEPPKEEDKKEEPEKEEEKKEPEKKEEQPDKKDDEEIIGLRAELEKLQGELEQVKAKGDSSAELAQVNALLTVQKNLVNEYESIIAELIEAKMAEVPENLKELVPANLSLKERMDWLAKAEKSGIFKVSNPDIEIGKPMNPNTVKQQADTAKLSASAIMAMAYGNSKSKK
ncbi:hypothetical protein JCM17380_24790 [Desulfosporosinus burensis]